MTPADQLLENLGARMTGDLARFTPGLVGPADPRAGVPADALLDAAMVAAIIARFEAKFGPTDRRAIFSMWASIYFAAALPPLLAANLLLGQEPDVAFGQVRFIVASNFRIEALQVGRGIRRLDDAAPAARFDGIVHAHLSPFIDRVADRTGVARRLLWSNAGNVFDAFTRHLRAVAALPSAPDPAGDLLARRQLPDGAPNPLFEPVRYPDGRRVRRVCCLRYLVPAQQLCNVCPLPAGHAARTALRRQAADDLTNPA